MYRNVVDIHGTYSCGSHDKSALISQFVENKSFIKRKNYVSNITESVASKIIMCNIENKYTRLFLAVTIEA